MGYRDIRPPLRSLALFIALELRYHNALGVYVVVRCDEGPLTFTVSSSAVGDCVFHQLAGVTSIETFGSCSVCRLGSIGRRRRYPMCMPVINGSVLASALIVQ